MTEFGYRPNQKSVIQQSGLVLVDKMTDDEIAYETARSTHIHKMVNFIIKRVQGKVGDILLTHECRIESLIDDYTDKFFIPKEKV